MWILGLKGLNSNILIIYSFFKKGHYIINQSIPLFKCQTNIAVEEPLNGDTIN